jgi:ABC-type transport system involved in multi-copper enzyme maturation permease subunit
METVWTIAIASFREAIRDRVLYTLFLFTLIMMALSHVVEALVMAQKAKVVKDIGLGAISIMGLLIAITIGAGIFLKEIRRLRGYSLLSKPISRAQFVLGKYLGAVITLALIIVLMGCLLSANAAAIEGRFDPNLLVGIDFIFVELSVVAAFALLFSTFCSPMVSGLLTFTLFASGHLVNGFKNAFLIDQYRLGKLFYGVFLLLPDLEKFDLKADAVYHTLPPWRDLFFLTIYGVIYVCLALFLSWVALRNKDVK